MSNNRSEEVFDYREFKKWWEDYKVSEPDFDKRNREISERARATLLESERMVEEWKNGMIARGMGIEEQND